jgi:CRISPR-associated protein Csm3
MATLIYKIQINAKIKVVTGLHIGGSDSVLDIGGIDNSVIKTKNGVPYIPGSSLKGKMRDLIARTKNFKDLTWDSGETMLLFAGTVIYKKDNSTGSWATNRRTGQRLIDKKTVPTRLITRDSFLAPSQLEPLHEKAENTINRATGEAKPRHIERVSPETIFNMDMILDIYDVDKPIVTKLLETLKTGFDLLENDYLGGSGSRGYGKIEFSDFQKSFPYIGEKPAQDVIDFNF